MTVPDLLARARSAIGAPTVYHLGQGGMDPDAPKPGAVAYVDGVAHLSLDCSGFVCWALGISRMTKHPLYVKFNGGWINTDAIVRDVERASGLFERPTAHLVPFPDSATQGFFLAVPCIGSLIVFPSKKPERPFGHVGIVSETIGGDVTKVIHCSHGNFAKFGDAIQETGPEAFRVPDVTFAWYAGLDSEIPT